MMRLLSNYFRYPAKVVEVVKESPRVKSLYLEVNLPKQVDPGQFVMVWLPNYEEVPLSPSLHEGNLLRITVAARGETTRAMHELRVGNRLIIRGPYGRGFKLSFKSYVLIAGGYGAAPLIYALHRIRELGGRGLYVVGARCCEELLFINEAKELGADVLVATEDGSLGHKGLVTDLLSTIDWRNYEALLTCGPEGMMKRIYDYIVSKGINIYAQFSLERYIKCGIGLCGSCAINGLRVCRDGPVFTLEELRGTEFGKYSRDASGRRVRIDY